MALLLTRYRELTGISPDAFVSGRGHHKETEQKRYEELQGYYERLKKYAERIEICGEHRNSYAKTDHDATFMRLKAVNFARTEAGKLVCPNGKEFTHYKDKPVQGNKYGRTEELYI